MPLVSGVCRTASAPKPSHGGSRLNASKPEANPKTRCPFFVCALNKNRLESSNIAGVHIYLRPRTSLSRECASTWRVFIFARWPPALSVSRAAHTSVCVVYYMCMALHAYRVVAYALTTDMAARMRTHALPLSLSCSHGRCGGCLCACVCGTLVPALLHIACARLPMASCVHMDTPFSFFLARTLSFQNTPHMVCGGERDGRRGRGGKVGVHPVPHSSCTRVFLCTLTHSLHICV